jgi:hypothetical protein
MNPLIAVGHGKKVIMTPSGHLDWVDYIVRYDSSEYRQALLKQRPMKLILFEVGVDTKKLDESQTGGISSEINEQKIAKDMEISVTLPLLREYRQKYARVECGLYSGLQEMILEKMDEFINEFPDLS